MAEAEPNAQDNSRQVLIQRLYLKDASMEVPDGPAIFRGKWEPQVDVQLNSEAESLEGDNYQVVLTVTVTAKQGEATAYICEVQQAGVFLVRGFDEREQHAVLVSFCPAQLYSYAREAISDLVSKASFPQFLLQPVNFDALYAEQMKAQQEQAGAGKAN